MSVKYNLKNFKKRSALLTNKSRSKTTGISGILVAAGETLILNLRSLWDKGIGGNDIPLEPPSANTKYISRKGEKTGRAKIDMLSAESGNHMVQQLGIDVRSEQSVAVGFKTQDARVKASANYKTRPQFFELSNRVKNLCIKKASDFYFKLVK